MSHRLVFILLLSVAPPCAQAQAAYPTVSKAEQKTRDDDRRPLLEAELEAERAALSQAQNDLATGATKERTAAVHRHQENIKALHRELDGIADQDVVERRERLVVKAVRSPSGMTASKRTANFWDPYNRAPDHTDFSTSPRRDSHE